MKQPQTIMVALTEDEANALEDLMREAWNGGEFASILVARHGRYEGRMRTRATERAMLAITVARRGASKIVRRLKSA